MNAPADPKASSTEGWTVQRILEWTTTFLKQKGVESARLEAELLLAHARKCQRIRLYTDFGTLLTDEERAIMRELVQRRAKREPLAYIVGTREFYGRSFEVGPGILIPRPETETLVDACLELIPKEEPREILEVGFGSGCIAITIAKQRPQCAVVATDISDIAAQVAARNSEKLGVTTQVTLLQGDTLEPVKNCGRRFDGLVSNPPYIREDERDSLQPEVAAHEPGTALFAGADGLNVVRRIIAQAPEFLKPGAFLSMELDPAQCEPVSGMLEAAGFESVTIRRDLCGNERVVTGVFGVQP
jgi:release factor glutamine methyltransferase